MDGPGGGPQQRKPEDGGAIHELTAAKLIEGITKVANIRGEAPWHLVDNIDGPASDLCIQYALFGEEKYA